MVRLPPSRPPAWGTPSSELRSASPASGSGWSSRPSPTPCSPRYRSPRTGVASGINSTLCEFGVAIPAAVFPGTGSTLRGGCSSTASVPPSGLRQGFQLKARSPGCSRRDACLQVARDARSPHARGGAAETARRVRGRWGAFAAPDDRTRHPRQEAPSKPDGPRDPSRRPPWTVVAAAIVRRDRESCA